ncbi:LysR family transcriptional regulator [Amphritea sp. 2_MG-2023]|jgi:LysR family glycine cleavage system transcriptional activator|uniref:LysR family transcriptional regulator n=1 Tax=Amphritea TaxID=515417 RepID=UPI001C069781|nr:MULTISPECIES: LysR family transcriptional regulator [Amphritea]MBU2965096.1 LysR family transcriptional regulator [Amphritea atlantica]MDO6418881.1 LysR family transcriptional regulator [Amphritea sp. 2_MG-2023]MDX2423634.1 LysR family transcriptional regulator [Amphritea sp.]
MKEILTNNIQLNWLRTFEAAGRKLSFTLSAQELNMSQSAVSQQIQLLEHHLNQQLFVRANRSIQLSDTGRSFLPLVQECLRQLNAGAAQIFTPLNKTVIEVNVNTTFSVLWLSTRLQRFNEIYPQITIRQLGTNWPTDFNISTAELEIRYGTGHWPGFESHPLVSPVLRPYCSMDTANRLRKPADLEGMPLLDVIGTPQGWSGWLKEMKLDHLQGQTRQFMDSHAAAVTMAANGFGVCLMYDELMGEGVLAKHLVAPFDESITTEGSYYLCYQGDKDLSAASRIFRDWLLGSRTHR